MEKYSMLMVLGEGSFGRVLLVQHKNRCQKYALKEIRLPESVFDTEKSWNECILLAKMKHPNIVTYAESFKADGHLYIVMEYCDDGDLMQKIKLQKGKFFPEDTICLGMKYIHDQRVLHRDIKSKNVFLTQNGKVKLGDFGSAILLTSPMAYACSYVGTPYYVPPEIWENTPYNNKSDIWSLGCILYELCTLKHPEERRYSRNKNSHSEAEAGTKSFCEMGLEKKGVDKTVSSEAVLQNPHRQQWEKGRSSTVINILENASLLSSSITSKEDTGGHVRKYDENIMRKQWTKEPPETLMNILHNAASDDLLRGPLNEETKTSDEPDGETAMEDSEILEHRSDEEDTDFEAEDDCDWISALETMTNMKSLTK
ncbi:serine/threonine-protein kinase Nek3 isoform X5 [Varanus komodoensis]|uniref:serine/threonine-protein kinase Nek3 isoform X5 n=1 Tax=Varanus komodoensis TaxID=61221 RepID=UPI001CF78411|nr:serine/threonine-protein kinase Nek3 isoform X5 [Varanus komodoensis]